VLSVVGLVSWELVRKATVFIAEEMGAALKRSAFSPNIKERVDHSCTVLDREGRIVAQAEHIPVH
jgi:N-methylhydantoinase B